ncbi:MAG: four helix bundle suffix domain-containing protein [Candidatus Shapirobacteria bacterium]
MQAGYKYLLSYQYALVICDLTAEFCLIFLAGREWLRQRDQMNQAARSGKQNIVEGYELQSLESYIKLLGVAQGSLMELLEDYQDYLRQHHLAIWPKESIKMRELRDVRVVRERETVPTHIPQYPHIPHNPELAANLMIMLTQRATYLLSRQIDSLKAKFVKEGGFRENLFQQRLAYKKSTA